jgi:hypothetical protein
MDLRRNNTVMYVYLLSWRRVSICSAIACKPSLKL